mmetsp:Transcript_35383/g.85357  ORF Transcript_35383/g.85357 Transcript_35383/m.85357 type:complete len:374 (-) Transcript_35383:704-1825(-)
MTPIICFPFHKIHSAHTSLLLLLLLQITHTVSIIHIVVRQRNPQRRPPIPFHRHSLHNPQSIRAAYLLHAHVTAHLRPLAIKVALAPVLQRAAEQIPQKATLLVLLPPHQFGLGNLFGEVRRPLLVDLVHGPDLLLDRDEFLGGEGGHTEFLSGGVLSLEGVAIVRRGGGVGVDARCIVREVHRVLVGIGKEGGGCASPCHARQGKCSKFHPSQVLPSQQLPLHWTKEHRHPRHLLGERVEYPLRGTYRLIVNEQMRNPVLGNETGGTIEVIFRYAIDVQDVTSAAVDHSWDQLYVPAYPNALPRPIVANPNARHPALLLAVEPPNDAVDEAERHPVIIQSDQAHAGGIHDLEIVVIDVPRWILGEEVGIVGL